MKKIKYQAEVDDAALATFRTGVLAWYRAHGRDLPWRRTTDPYYILVSELMLHQTTVKTVEPVYQAFIQRFPTIYDLASAPIDEVKAITDPLGYKVRGQWLHTIAQVVVNEHQGRVPDTLDGLMSLPGIGRYTAGAILSFAFGQDAPILDTNVKRVLGRYFDVDYARHDADTHHRLWALAEAVIPPGEAAEFNQALMDIGAMVCSARKPLCTVCPLASHLVRAGAASLAAEERVPYTVRARTPNPVQSVAAKTARSQASES